MLIRRTLIPVAFALVAAGCSDGVAPPTSSAQPPLGQVPHFLRWAGPVPPQFSTIGAPAGPVGDGVLLMGAPALSLDRYTATFWAVRGQERSVQINYRSATGETTFPFLRLADVEPSYAPYRGPLQVGDSVLITVIIDPSVIKVSLEPTGLQFGDPAELRIWYGGAGGDLNGDGLVNDTDAYVESQLLGMWYREGPVTAWGKIPATQSLSEKSLTSALQHFSEYAVSW